MYFDVCAVGISSVAKAVASILKTSLCEVDDPAEGVQYEWGLCHFILQRRVQFANKNI